MALELTGGDQQTEVCCGGRDSQTLTHCFAPPRRRRPIQHALLFKRNGTLTPEPPALPESPPDALPHLHLGFHKKLRLRPPCGYEHGVGIWILTSLGTR